RYRNSAVASVQRPSLLLQPLDEHGILGAVDVRGLLPAAVGASARRCGVRRRHLALCGMDRVKLLAFLGITIFVHGPLSPFLPTAYEATLFYYARLYPWWLLALIGPAGATLSEVVNYRLIDWVTALPALSAMTQRRAVRWSVDAFLKAPFWTTAFVIFSPIPDSAVRVLAPLGRYPMWKFLGATAVGRLPRFLLIAGFGWLVH